MKAWRLYNGQINEIDVDVDPNGQPILPPETTVAARPEALPGHYVTIQGDQWVQIEIVAPSLFQLKNDKMMAFNVYRQKYMDKPVEVNGVMFDADSTARERLTQALVMNTAFSYLPPVWITHDNSAYTLADLDALKAIALAVQTAFATRFYEIVGIRDSVTNASTEEELNAIVIPENV